MHRRGKVFIGLALGVGTLLGTAWLGLQIEPLAFPPSPNPTTPAETVGLRADLPAPVARYFRAVLGDRVPVLTSAVLTGRARLRVAGVTFPTRLRFIHRAGRDYRHDIESTWFGLPVLRVHESYLNGHARLEQPFGSVAGEPKVDSAANLALWGEELFWLPSVLATDPRVQWEEIDQATARLVVPFGQAEDRFTVTFDAATGLIRRVEALRYRAAGDQTKTPWRFEPVGWQTFHGVRLPSPAAVTWLDQGSPWLVLTLEAMAFNVDVAPSFGDPGR